MVMPTDVTLYELAAKVGERFAAARRRVATAESCTGGWIAKALTDVPGSSQWFECGFVTYSNRAKTRDLGVEPQTLAQQGAVSEATVREMASGALHRSGADAAVAVSGIAGPDGGLPDKPVGTVWFCTVRRGGDGTIALEARVEHFAGDREAVRRATVALALRLLAVLPLEMDTGHDT